ncbi:DUF2169 family type VI secretion system accessory protein [Pseudomonas carnis]|uniref:DUF2169 family type VI secretion system accessory protein n=1 Tax=Pseudomonas carnis TaxID=2487355 RepID=UPI001BC8E897|nr:DUF2169 domain-containing protein [Pseudomonas carnis]
MDIINETSMQAEATLAIDATGQRFVIAMAKATYAIPSSSEQPTKMAQEQIPILTTDVFEGEPGLSTPFFECDYALFRARCDIVLKATAHAPGKRSVNELEAGFEFGDCVKTVRVVGNRYWRPFLLGFRPSEPEPFRAMPITYSRAFGGTWLPSETDSTGTAYSANPIGCGFATEHHVHALMDQHIPVPNLEQPGHPVLHHFKQHRPWSFGPVGRSWTPRQGYAGTYDDNWHATTFPLLPADFDPRFCQCAPEDQQVPYPQGGEPVRLINLHPEHPDIRFKMPRLALGMSLAMRNSQVHVLQPVVDCVAIDADAGVFSVVWRARHSIKRSLSEIELLSIGQASQQRAQAHIMGQGGCFTCSGFATDEASRKPILEDLDL